jgi:type II secretory pathway component PulJ
MRKQNGFSLIELVVAGSLSSLLLFSVYSVIHTSSRLSLYQGTLSQAEGDMVFATRLIQKIGRVASQCRRPPGGNSLECLVDFSRPAAGLNQWVRFLLIQGAGGGGKSSGIPVG